MHVRLKFHYIFCTIFTKFSFVFSKIRAGLRARTYVFEIARRWERNYLNFRSLVSADQSRSCLLMHSGRECRAKTDCRFSPLGGKFLILMY